MSTRAGDPTATQSPSAPPTPGATPTLNDVVDGTPANAASVQQQFKALADFEAWVFSPRAASGVYAQEVVAWRTALLHRRFGVDHRGFQNGQVNTWDETWLDNGLGLINTPGSGPWGGKWSYKVSGNGSINAVSSDTVHQGSAFLNQGIISAGGPTTSISLVQMTKAPVTYRADGKSDISMSWDGQISGGGGAMEMCQGFTAPSLLSENGLIATLAPVAAMFIGRIGDTNIQAYAKNSLGAASIVDTGVALDVGTRFRIDTMGSGESDDSTARTIFFIDGVQVANIALDISGGTDTPLFPFFRMRFLGDALNNRRVGAVRGRNAIYGGDLFI